MRKLLHFCFELLLLFSVNYVLADVPNQVATNNTLHNLHVNAIIQDKLGYIWIGTAKGLCRYNGYEYVHYYHDGDDPKSISSDVINKLLCDSQGRVWIATGSGLDMFDYNTGYFKHYSTGYASVCLPTLFESGDNIYTIHTNCVCKQPKDGDKMSICFSSPSMLLSNICPDGDKTWVAAKNSDSARLTLLDKHMRPCMDPITFESADILCLFAHNGVLWVGTSRGIKLIDSKTYKPIEHTEEGLGAIQKFRNLSVTLVQELSENQIVIGTNNYGLFIYSLKDHKLTPCSKSSIFANVDSQHITSFLKDNLGNLWVGTFDKGYYLETHHKNLFNKDNVLQNYLRDKFVSHVIEDSKGNLVIATRIYGLIYYDKQRRTFKEYNNNNSKLFGDATTNFIQSIFIDSQDRLWVGSDSQLTVCKLSKGVFSPIKSFPIKIVDIIEDSRGRIWVGTETDGMFIFENILLTPRNLVFVPGTNNITKMVNIDQNRILCSSYSMGLYVINIHNLQFSSIKLPLEASRLSKSIIYIYRDSSGLFWLGSYGNGAACYNIEQNSIRLYLPKDGLPSNDVLAIVRRGNNVWMSTSFGLARLSIENNIFVNFHDYDGIGGNQFHEKSVYEGLNGMIYFSGNHGLTVFNPSEIDVPHSSIPVILENLKIFNNNVSIGGNDGVLQRSLAQTQSITLSHKQNVFSIDYAGIDLALSQKINYAYKLENFDKEWNYVNDFRRASYSNLPPGEYQFCVKAQSQDGTWDNSNPTRLLIKVRYSPWTSPLALIIYILATTFIVVSFVRLYIRNKLNREGLAISELEKSHEKELTQMKMNFFANIAHELRTPLTLIYGCANMLNRNDPAEGSQLIGLINYNVGRLLRLLGEILDYNKIQKDTLPLMISNNDLAPIVNNVIGSYRYYAKEKNITLLTQMPQGTLQMFADFEKLDKVINNLISNALKYTKEGGRIVVCVDILDSMPEGFAIKVKASKYLKITIEDNGVGVSPENIEHLFERYRRFDENHGHKKIDGFGIGLNYVKKLVLTHKGDIIATHNQPYGMIFSFAIPIDEQSYLGSEFCEDVISRDIFVNEQTQGIPPTYVNNNSQSSETQASCVSRSKREHTVLVVEDNVEVRMLIYKILGQRYKVETAVDGIQGLEMVSSAMPDVIISDVIMPNMNGFELCAQVKQNPEYCHIPVILLTARTGNKDQIEGYSFGADAYIEKPFYPELLITIIRNQLERRERVKVLVTSQAGMKDVPQEAGLNPLDMKFINKLHEYIEMKLSNENLNVNFMGKELGFSRSSFYRKVTGLTGQSPNDFLRIYRLNRAAELIVEGKYMMSEVAEITGFGSYPNFSTRFKQHFGVSPRRYTVNHTAE